MGMIEYMELRFSGYYKIGFFNRLFRYPLVAIIILDCKAIDEEEKEKFKNEFLYPYMNDREFRKKFDNRSSIIFCDGKYEGIFDHRKKPKARSVVEYYKEFPCHDKTIYNKERFWFLH